MDKCYSATVLDDAWRATTYNPRQHNNDYHCDKDLHGWYRFRMGGKDATIPTTCVQSVSNHNSVLLEKSADIMFAYTVQPLPCSWTSKTEPPFSMWWSMVELNITIVLAMHIIFKEIRL